MIKKKKKGKWGKGADIGKNYKFVRDYFAQL